MRLIPLLLVGLSLCAQDMVIIRRPVRVASGGATFPSEIAGLVAHYKADAGVSCSGACSDGGVISQWSDQSGNSNHLVVWSGKTGPAYYSNQINGHAATRWTIYTAMSFASSIPFNSGKTIFVASKQTNADNPGEFVTSNPNGLIYRNGSSAGKVNGLVKTDVAEFNGNAGNTLNVWRQQNASYDGSNYAFRLARADDGSGVNVRTITQPLIGVGMYYGDAEHFRGDIAELIIFDGALPLADKQAVEDYLFAKYGI